jgi:hypothetical protein
MFGLLDFTMLRPVLTWRAVWNLWTVYFFNFPTFFSGRGKLRILNQRIRGPDCSLFRVALNLWCMGEHFYSLQYWRWVVRFMAWLLYSWSKKSLLSLDMRLNGPQSHSGHDGKEEMPMHVANWTLFVHPVVSWLLYQLACFSSYIMRNSIIYTRDLTH